MSNPYYFQDECITAINQWFSEGKKNPLAVLATGTGKSFVIAKYFQQAYKFDPDVRCVCVIDTKELVLQNYERFLQFEPMANAGIYSSGLRQKRTKAQFLFCGIQSVYNKAADIGKADIMIIDEAHMIGWHNSSMYEQFINEMLTINPHMIVIGMTATPYRQDTGLIYTPYNNKEPLFKGVCYEYSIKQGIADGVLSELRSKATETNLMLQMLKSVGVNLLKASYKKPLILMK